MELLRDPIRLTFALLGPLILMVAFGYGISLDVEHLRFGAFDQDRSPESRSLIEAFTASPRYFDQMPPIGTSEEFDRRFRSGDLQVAIEIPPGFGRDLQIGRTPDVAVWLDGSMPFRAETTKGYVTALAAQYLIAQRTLRNSPASTINPLRLSYSLLSDRNPMMRVVAQLAEQALAERTVPVDNPFVALQQQFSKAVIDVLNLYRDMRDQLVEQTFHVIYGSPVVQAAFGISQNDGPPRPRPGLLPSTQAATEAEIHRLRGRVAKGGSLEAAARALVYIGKARHRVEERTFDALRRLLLAHPEVSPAAFKAVLCEQWAILTIDEQAAIEALPQLLATGASERRAFLDAISAIVMASGDLNSDAQRRLKEIERLLETGPLGGSTRPSEGQVAAE
jgi:Protein of unknown function (DUF3141)/ABC-2 family transporter protein